LKERRLRLAHFRPGVQQGAIPGRWVNWLDEQCLRARARLFARRLTRLVETLPMCGAVGLCGDELLLSAGLIGTNCQVARQAASAAEFRQKLRAVAEEAAECQAWLELLREAGVIRPGLVEDLTEEADALLAVTANGLRAAEDGPPRTGCHLRIVRPWQERRRWGGACGG
jgi:four helix bundle protein